MHQLKALIFDVDGTLAETEELHREAFNQSFASEGLEWRWEPPLYAELLETTGGKERIRRFIDHNGARPALDDGSIAKLHAHKTAVYGELVAKGSLKLRPGVQRLLQDCRSGAIRLAIATTTSRENVEVLLRSTLGYQPFEVIAAGDEVRAKKPAPDVYQLALERLGLPPASCIAFEDTSNGLASASRAGIACIVTTSVYGGFGPFPGALAVVDGLGDAETPTHSIAGPKTRGSTVSLADLGDWLTLSQAE